MGYRGVVAVRGRGRWGGWGELRSLYMFSGCTVTPFRGIVPSPASGWGVLPLFFFLLSQRGAMRSVVTAPFRARWRVLSWLRRVPITV